MQADILVLDTPFYTQVDANGQFDLTGIADMNGVLKIWHPRANVIALKMTGNENNAMIKQEVSIIRPKVPAHTNKFGKSYRPTRDDE
jgi:hypothetical protein